jgi:hypothetical protein
MHPAVVKSGQVIVDKIKQIPPQDKKRARNIILLILLILIFKNRISNLIRNLTHKDINQVDVNKGNLTYDRSEYYSMCSTLESAMDGAGTKEESIMTVMMRLKTQDDWNFLQKCFGIRKKRGGLFYKDVTGDLKMWLSDDLNSSELREVRDILQSSGINF